MDKIEYGELTALNDYYDEQDRGEEENSSDLSYDDYKKEAEAMYNGL